MRRSTPRFRLLVSQHPLRMLLAFAAALLLAVALPVQAQEGVEGHEQYVVVVPGDGSEAHTVAWSQLVDDAHTTSFNFTEPGKATRSVTGVSLGDLFRRLGIASTSWSGISVDRAEGGATAVSSEQMLSSRGIGAIVFMDADGKLKLLRQTDVELASAIDGTLTLRLQQEPKVTASQPETLVGEPLKFSATLPADVEPAHVTYEWEFNDDKDPVRTSDPIVTRSFERVGEYNVTATFFIDGKRWDKDTPPFATIRVVRAPPGPLSRRRDAQAGARRRAARRRSAQGNRDTRDEETAPPETPSDDSGGTPPPTYTPPPAATPTPTPAPTPAPVTPTPTPTPTPDPKPKPDPKPRPARKATAPTQPQGTMVDGYLLASAGAPLPVGAALDQAELTQQALADQASKSLHIPALVWVLIGLVALVLLGWGLESRTTLPYFKP